MTTVPSEADVAAIHELIQRSTMRGIEYHRVGAEATRSMVGDEDRGDINMEIAVQHRCSESDFGIRLVASITTDYGTADATVAAVYDYEGDPPSQRALFGFINEVAIMAIFPFLREAVHTITSKVFGQPILLPTFERGAVGYDLDDAKDASALTK